MVNWENTINCLPCLGSRKKEDKGKNREADTKVNAQEWLDKEYPKEGCVDEYGEKVKRSEAEEIYLNEPTLERELDLGDFTYEGLLGGVKIHISLQVDETKLTFKNKPKNAWIVLEKTNDAQKNIEYNYPTQEVRKKETRLNISFKNLEGQLDLSDFINLKELDCQWNKLTSLDLTNCQKLEKINCSSNRLTNITFPPNITSLEELCLNGNNLPNQDLINKYNLCLKCKEPNTSKNWCQPCVDQEWKKDLEQLSGQKLVEKFIQQQKETGKYSNLKWIPYEKFFDIEHLADGGFSKIYKTEWGWRNEVVLKILNNSQNITLEFLTEIANTNLVSSGVVRCHGISQEPTTKNYMMVMEYMKGGNLRQVLQNKNEELDLWNKFGKLKVIANGLNSIHNQNLVHRDFHSGNILYGIFGKSGKEYSHSYITDLGLSKSINTQVQQGEIFGVLPYVAPEVLKGKPYTKASDIYSFGIVAYELLANSYPYPEMDDRDLALKVCWGYRPDIDKVPIPQKVKDFIKRCWDADPEKRPNSWELNAPIPDSFSKEVGQEYYTFSKNITYQIHHSAITTSKTINTREINRLLKQQTEKYHMGTTEELIIDDFSELTIQEEEKAETSLQTQIPPKQN